MTGDLLDRVQVLRTRGEPFVLATVVRMERPASARPGMKAIVTASGRLEGWVGGACAHTVVVREALHLLRAERAGLLRLSPTATARTERGGVIEEPMTCHSGGTLEIYLEPVLPPPRLVLVGDAPLTDALAAIARMTGFDVRRVHALEGRMANDAGRGPEIRPEDRALALDELRGVASGAYVVVATMGQYDEDALARVAGAGAAYVGLVASPRRAAAVRAGLARRGVDPAHLEALRAPAGLDLGALTPEEIAVSILAEIVSVRRGRSRDLRPAHATADDLGGETAQPARETPAPAAVLEAVDPVCGMTVDTVGAAHTAEHGGV
ncbi:MAG: XdhC family protein, partial [Armatimonadota bacterium]|nr:XdhC family protein [Armatimonadota bacterium]